MGMLRRRHEERHVLADQGVEVQRDEIDADNTAETEPLEGVDDTRDSETIVELADTTVHHGTRGNVNSVKGDEAEGSNDEDGEVLKGAALDEALTAAGLSKSGTADEKRQRLAERDA